jgi:hypothetical protein
MITLKNIQGVIIAIMTVQEYIAREAAELEALMVMASHDPL